MSDGALDRRNFLKSAVVGGAAAATPAPLPETAKAEQAATASASEGYAFFNLAEAAFVEALVDHMPDVNARYADPQDRCVLALTYLRRIVSRTHRVQLLARHQDKK